MAAIIITLGLLAVTGVISWLSWTIVSAVLREKKAVEAEAKEKALEREYYFKRAAMFSKLPNTRRTV